MISRRITLMGTAALGGSALLWLGACGRKAPPTKPLPSGSTVLALGDSLTFGTGAAPEASYPAQLQALTGWQVINAGVPGDTAVQGAARLPALLGEHQPALVLICLGGNDFLRGMPEHALRSSLRKAITLARAAGAQVMLVAVPRPAVMLGFSGVLSDHPLYGELAEELQLVLLRQAWSEVLVESKWRSDPIHANALGYAEFARRLKSTAVASGLLAKR